MRYLLMMITLSTSLLLFSCKDKSTQPGQISAYYDQMLFLRKGGGDLQFHAYPTSSSDTFKIFVSRKDFRDTAIDLNIAKVVSTSSIFDTLTQTLCHQIELTGNFKQDTIPTGTWAFIYFTTRTDTTEVTNINLRNTLIKVEQIVRSKF